MRIGSPAGTLERVYVGMGSPKQETCGDATTNARACPRRAAALSGSPRFDTASMMWRWAGLAGCAVAFAAGCSQRPADPATVNVSDLSVVWIVLDAAGARYLGAYGNPLPASPNVDALARDGGTVFGRAYAQSSWTLPSTASFLTGRYPRRRRQPSTQVGR